MNSTVSQPPHLEPTPLRQPAAAVEQFMAGFIDRRPLPLNLREAIRYALLGHGKRLRPRLVLLACEAVGGGFEAAVVPAAAIEMVHCFSLVHDDLPAMDDDDLRRGRPTLHKHTNEAMAILAGDAMLALAFELVATEMRPADLANQITCELATATNQMIAGQVFDTLGSGENTVDPIQQLMTTHRHKTAALIRCCGRMGALCGQADTDQLNAITRYSNAIGLMFQIIDDLLDVTQTTQHLGKAANKDMVKGKMTYPGVLGVEASRQEVARLRNEARQAVTPLGQQAHGLVELCDYLAIRQK